MDDASKEDISKFAKDMGVNYPILIGKESVGDEYGGVPALPESFLIGRDGKIVDKILGLRGKAEIEDAIKKALDTRPASSQASIPQPSILGATRKWTCSEVMQRCAAVVLLFEEHLWYGAIPGSLQDERNSKLSGQKRAIGLVAILPDCYAFRCS